MVERKKVFSDGVYAQDLILDPIKYHKTISLLRDFFLQKGFYEVPAQSRLAILAACEDPQTVATFDYRKDVWPLPQTGQMWLEYELLTRPNVPGYFCASTSYRNEPNPIPGRHKVIFPLFEFETHGGQEDLAKLEKELCAFIGLVPSADKVPSVDYETVALRYGVKELEDEHEIQLEKDYGPVCLLENFPVNTSPFWNMRLHPGGKKAKKIDAIIAGQETIGSAERAVDREEMRHQFHTVSDGGYARLLYDKFGKDRVEKELDDYLSLDFFDRCGGGIGVTRMIYALDKYGVI